MPRHRSRGSVTALPLNPTLLWAGVSVLVQPLRLSAQTLEGRVIDARTEDPVAMAYVALVTRDQRSIVAVTADVRGTFSLDAPGPGSYYVSVSSIGYRPLTDGIFELGEGSSMEVEIRLQPDPVMMDSIRATVDRTERYLRQVGFYERREQGWGRQLTHEEISQRAVFSVVDAIRHIPRVQAVEGVEAGYPSLLFRHGVRLCPPHVYVDGFFYGAAKPDELVHPADIAAIELYRSRTEAPLQYGMSGCGVLLIWTWH